MKERPVLISVIILSLIVEVIIMVLVYDKIGGERLPFQIGRLLFQLICIFFILTNKSNTALFLITAYHIVSGLFGLYSSETAEMLGKIFIGYHFIIGLAIYFHDWIESKFGIKNVG